MSDDWRRPFRMLYDLRNWTKPEGCICAFPPPESGREFVLAMQVALDFACPWHGIMSDDPIAALPPTVVDRPYSDNV